MKKYLIIGQYTDFAGEKFPRDIEKICIRLGYKVLPGYRGKKHILNFIYTLLKIERKATLIYLDTIKVSYARSLLYFIMKLKKINVITIVEDIDLLRFNSNFDDKEKYFKNLSNVSYIISQNKSMTRYLRSKNLKTKIIDLNVLDFISDKIVDTPHEKRDNCIICYGGNLSAVQSGFLRKVRLDEKSNIKYNVYGGGEISSVLPKNLVYRGKFTAETCIENIKGDWGLVWNGQSTKINEGDNQSTYYNYVSPHKFSMYALCGMPVIVSNTSAMADFVKLNNCGIVIDDVNKIPDKLEKTSYNEYLTYRTNIIRIAKEISVGAYTEKTIKKVESELGIGN